LLKHERLGADSSFAGKQTGGGAGSGMRIEAFEQALGLNAASGGITGLAAVSPAGKALGTWLTPGKSLDEPDSLALSDIIRLLDLGKNKLAVLRLLRRTDWIRLLYLLPKELLVAGLNFFSKEKLLALVLFLPREYLIRMMLFLFSVEDLVKKMPTIELMRILRSRKLDNRALLRGFQAMDPRFLKMVLVQIYGDGDYANMKPYELWRLVMHADKRRLMEAFRTLPFKALIPFVTGFVKEDPELLGLLSDEFIFKLFDQTGKAALIESCIVLPEELLIRLLLQLPDKFLVAVAAQIDDTLFADYLVSQQANLLRSLAA
jgi:hypothetical protein